jgi:hypothetical protein
LACSFTESTKYEYYLDELPRFDSSSYHVGSLLVVATEKQQTKKGRHGTPLASSLILVGGKHAVASRAVIS